VSVSIDRGGEEKVRELVKSYSSKRKLTFINLLDPKSVAAGKYGVRGVPITFFINPQGKAVAVANGYLEWDTQKGLKMFDQWLAQKTEG